MKKIRQVIVKIHSLAVIALLLQLFFISCSDKPEELEIKSERDDIVAIMQNTQNSMQAPGWSVGIQSPAKDYKIAGGKANLDQGTDMLTSDYLRIGSISKSFTATLILILCDEGAISLNEKLEDYYPDFPSADKVTIRQLLMHTSGIVSWDEDEEIRMQIFNGIGDWTIDKLIDWAAQQPFHFEPGTAYHYSNIGYFLLGKIIEQASNTTVADLLQEKICVPLELNSTFMPETTHPAGETVHGYDGSTGSVVDMTGTPQADAINFELAWTAGGMLSSLDDLAIWIRSVANGDLLSDSLHIQQMPVLSPPSQSIPFWNGYGMGISQTDVWLGHTGAVCGFVCNMSYYHEEDMSIITFYNKFSAFDLDANTADIIATAENFIELAQYFYPETLQPEN